MPPVRPLALSLALLAGACASTKEPGPSGAAPANGAEYEFPETDYDDDLPF